MTRLNARLSRWLRTYAAVLGGVVTPRDPDQSDAAAWDYLRSVAGYGTIVLMADRRVRLSTADIALICSALRARAAMTTGLRRHRVERLAERLSEGVRGNPKWVHSIETQTHEEDIDPEDAE